jgi:hypothetical protein
MPPENDPRPTREEGYERRDASVRGLLLFGLGLAIVIVFTFYAMKWTFNWLSAETPRGPAAAPFESAAQVPPAPLLQAHPHQDLWSYCEGQLKTLNSYGWIDKQNGIVHIPIERAMDLLLQQGFPARPASEIGPYDKQAITPVGSVNALPAEGIGGQCKFVDENPTYRFPKGGVRGNGVGETGN